MRPAAFSLTVFPAVLAGLFLSGAVLSGAVGENPDPLQNAETWLGRDADLLLEMAHAVDAGKRGDLKTARAQLSRIAEAAQQREQRQAWLEAQRWGLRFSVKEMPQADILAAVEELLARAREGRMRAEEVEIFSLWSEVLEAGGQWLAAVQAQDRASQAALDAGLTGRGVEALLQMMRLCREAEQPERRRQVWMRIRQVLALRPEGIPERVWQELARERAEEPAIAETAPAGPGAVDLQPSVAQVLVSSPDRELGRTRFVLTNASPFTVRGILRVTPEHSRVTRRESGELGVYISLENASADGMAGGEAQEMTLLPGRQMFVYLERGPDGPEETVRLSWEQYGKPAAQAKVTYFFRDGLPPVSVINAGVYRLQQGWSIPLYHEIYGRRRRARIENLQVKSSAPARLEIMDQDSGKMLAVDAEGDGFYFSVGDRVLQDLDGDGNPDLIVGDRAQALEIQVWPAASSAGEITVTAGLRDGPQASGWRTDATNTVRPVVKP